MFGFFQQVTVEVVDIGGASAIEVDFLLEPAVGVIVEAVDFADFVFDFGEQQSHVVVAVVDLGAVRIDAPADQGQTVGVFVAGDAPQFIAFGGDSSVGVVAVFPRCHRRA